MQQPGFAHIQKAPAALAAIGNACVVTRLGEVRPYAPFGLMHLDDSSYGERSVTLRTEGKDPRGRTGLAA